jgi:hypothetical protein
MREMAFEFYVPFGYVHDGEENEVCGGEERK